MSLLEVFTRWERERIEKILLSPNRIWFQRHETKPNIIAEICLIGHHKGNYYRWRAYYGRTPWGHQAEGRGKTLAKAKKQVFKFFAKH